MDKQLIIHSEKCLDPTTPKRKLCKPCYSKYKYENRKLNKLKRAGVITQPSETIDQISKYGHLYCDACKDKSFKYSCVDCKKKVQSARYKVSQNNKKNKLDVVNKAIIPTGAAHSNQENSTINDCDDINSNDGIGGTSANNYSDTDGVIGSKKEKDQCMNIYFAMTAKKKLRVKFVKSVGKNMSGKPVKYVIGQKS